MAEAEGRKEQRGTECLGKLDAPPGHFSLNEKTRDHYCAFARKVKRGSWVSLTDTLRSCWPIARPFLHRSSALRPVPERTSWEACCGIRAPSVAHPFSVEPKSYRTSNKNDFLDAEAIAEAVTKQNMPLHSQSRTPGTDLT
jgi:hypothetical protein